MIGFRLTGAVAPVSTCVAGGIAMRWSSLATAFPLAVLTIAVGAGEPDEAALVRTRAQSLEMDGRYAEATGLLEGYLAEHGTAEAYWMVVNHHAVQGNEALARDFLDLWLEDFPGDPRALAFWLGHRLRDAGEAEKTRLEDEAVGRMDVGPHSEELCSRMAAPAVRRCFSRVIAESEDPELRGRALAGFARVAARTDDWGALADALEKLPEDRRPQAVLSAGGAAATAGHCDAALELFASIRRATSRTTEYPSAIARLLVPCSSRPAARTFFFELVDEAQTRSLRNLVSAWRGKVPAPELERRVRERMAGERDEDLVDRMWEALHDLYAEAPLAERVPLLEDWVAAVPGHHGGTHILELADLLIRAGRDDDALRVLESAPEGSIVEVWERLGHLYFLRGDADAVTGLADRLRRSPKAEHARTAVLLDARAALVEEDVDRALEHYRAFLEDVPPRDDRALDEYLWLLRVAGRQDEMVPFLERRYAAKHRVYGLLRSRDEYVAEKLAAVGRTDEALAFLGRARERSPERAVLHLREAELAEQAGDPSRAEAAWRRLLALDAGSMDSWNGLARAVYELKALDRLEEAVDRSEEALGKPAPEALLLLGRSYREAGRLLDAIRALRRLQQHHPQYHRARPELDAAYAELARQE